MYKVFKVDEGWQVFRVDEDLKRPLDGEKIYRSRQNAYARAKQLNEKRKAKKMHEVHIEIEAMRNDCKALIERISEDFGGAGILVIDPLLQYSEQRYIRFSRKFRESENEPEPEDEPGRLVWMPRTPIFKDILAKLAKYRDLDEVLGVKCQVADRVWYGNEIR